MTQAAVTPSEPEPGPESAEPEPESAESKTPAGVPEEAPRTTPTPTGPMPEYKGEPLDGERGPGLGCFWIQIGLLTFFLVFTPLTVTWGWDPMISAVLLIFTLILLLFSGQTIIFLLRLVAADRRNRRAPLDPSARPTVGQMEDAGPETSAETSSEARAASAVASEPDAQDDVSAAPGKEQPPRG